MSLYDDVVTIAKEYIGPAGQKFIDRQLESHLNLSPAELNKASLFELSKWCFASGRLIIDAEEARSFQGRVNALAEKAS
ncbi:MAG: hypothetical protein JXA17_06830 [Dehalococcoidales bacterium]|nr:hypothetical protein [Dehalococcoidales bacterium]